MAMQFLEGALLLALFMQISVEEYVIGAELYAWSPVDGGACVTEPMVKREL